jgi:membrane-associated phospholipid phosphatase
MKLGRLNLADKSTLVYNLIVILLLILFSHRIPSWHRLILLNLSMIAAIVFLFARVTDRSPAILRFLASFYPMFFFFGGYQQTERMNLIFFDQFLDPFFRRIEYGLFGTKPAIVLAEHFPQWWISEYMHFAYFSYYLLFPIMGIILYLGKDRRIFEEYMFTLCSSFYIYYLIFIALPVIGAESVGLPATAADGPFTRIMRVLYHNFEVGGGAFPSSHAGVAALLIVYAFGHLRKPAAWICAVLCVSLMIATVYCRYHYAIDAISGALTGLALTYFWRRFYRAHTESSG